MQYMIIGMSAHSGSKDLIWTKSTNRDMPFQSREALLRLFLRSSAQDVLLHLPNDHHNLAALPGWRA